MTRPFSLAALLAALSLAGCVPNFAESPTATARPVADAAGASHVEGDYLVAGDGAHLPLVSWLPVDAAGQPAPVRAVVLALHGMNDRKAAFSLSAPVWQRDGIATFAYDQRGFGANPNPGRWPGSATFVADLAGAIKAMRARYPGIPLYVLGESMGGAIVLDAFGGQDAIAMPLPDGIILSAPAVWGRRTESLLDRVALWAAIRTIPSVSFTGAGLGVQASDNIPMLRALGRDPLFVKDTRVDSIYGLVNLMDDGLVAGAADHLPTLLLYGEHDHLIPPSAMQILIDELPGRADGRLRIVYYPDGWHMLLRDLDYPTVAEDVAGWIFDRSAPIRSGHEFTAEHLPKRPRKIEDGA